ncbi:sodium- and chloride-dependent GABA transporter ine-like [Babylonia areolata]|uniref:sodium- and chloride-dependent GABA transporter ine-like n=1 Tax=Babylonia areolata TaxID=304850 RepID=UPI003FD62611
MERESEVRENWSKKVEYLLAIIGYAVGLGNVWRFPYLCFESGGGAFLIPFFIMLVLCGVPLAYMEMAIGQYTRRGPVGAIGKLCPFFKGAGLATVVISFLFTTYYVIIITWAFFYMFSTFQSQLPWVGCGHPWSSPRCWVNSSNATLPRPNDSRSPTEDFYLERVLERTSGIEEQGGMRWELLGLLLLSWVIVYFCIWKGPKSTGKVVYFTATFPYVVLITLLVRGVTLPGSEQGISYFINPDWSLLLNAKVWVYAAAQTFNSLGVAFGGLITMSSYNKYNNKILRDVLALAVVDAITCLLAGFAIFSILGYLAFNQGKDVVEVVKEGPGLVFVIYPEAFVAMPASQLFAFLFFFMLVCLGIDSQFASVEVVVTTIQDHFGDSVKHYLRRKEVLVVIVCFISFLCGLPNITQGGQWFFSLIDHYAAALSLMILAFFEVIAVSWFYGARRLSRDIQDMTGSGANLFFVVCWLVVSPLLILSIFIFSMVQYSPLSFAGYTYPVWAQVMGWGIALLSVACIPLGMLHAVYRARGTQLWMKIKHSLKPVPVLDSNSGAPFSATPMLMTEKPAATSPPTFVAMGSKGAWLDPPRDCTKL